MFGNLDPLNEYLLEYLKKRHICYSITDKSKILEDNNFIENSIKDFSPDIILHFANVEDIDYCEEHSDEISKINKTSTTNIAKAASLASIPILYFSSSCVFDGNSDSPYKEVDKPNPINAYGKSKLDCEKIIQKLCDKYFILRTSFYYGDSNCLVKKIISNKASLFYSADYYINPTYIKDIALLVEKLIESKSYGIYHCGSKGYTTKVDFTKFVLNEINSKSKVKTLPNELKELYAPRPNFAVLSNKLITEKFNIEMKSWEENLKNYIDSLT